MISTEEERIKQINERIAKRQKSIDDDREALKLIEKARRKKQEVSLRIEKEKWREDLGRAMMKHYAMPVSELVAIIDTHLASIG
jgi:regulator of protease activity HflC (stomatin/prohibitin superfamily)